METKILEEKINGIKYKYPKLRNYKDDIIFTLVCMKYFLCDDDDLAIDDDYFLESIIDNNDDIDAIMIDSCSDNNDIAFIQIKYDYNDKLMAKDIEKIIGNMIHTVDKLNKNIVDDFDKKAIITYRNAKNQKDENGINKIKFFTAYQPKTKRTKNSLDRTIKSKFIGQEIEVYFKDDIEAQISVVDSEKLFVEQDKIEIDKAGNYLSYEDSIIVNISALSLQDLENRRRNALLGMNLRYYVKQKQVDSGIEKTIQEEPENFWYKNNGIIIICDDYKIDGNIIYLSNFSIINGGQTTNRIGREDIEKNFYLQAKIIKSKGETKESKDLFLHKIAESSNAQKPIKISDLKANSPEQLRLKEQLNKYKVYYITKKGDKAPKQYSEKYQSCTLDKVGKLSLAGILQMPGSARSNSKKCIVMRIMIIFLVINQKQDILLIC